MSNGKVKRGVIAVALFLILLGLPHFINAFGISAPYIVNDTLRIQPGHSYNYVLTIQNGETEDYYVDITYSSTKNIVVLDKTAYFTPAHTYNNTIHFNITVPLDAKIGDKYLLEYNAKPRTNSTSTVSPTLEIKGHVDIVTVDENNSAVAKADNTAAKTGIWHKVGTYFLIIIIIAMVILIANRLWKLSKGLSSKLSNERVTNYTISQAMNLKEVQELLEKISDEEFRLTEIRNLFKEKISELTTHNLTKEINDMSRKEVIKAIDKIR